MDSRVKALSQRGRPITLSVPLSLLRAYLHSLLNYSHTFSIHSALLSVPRVCTTFASRGFSVSSSIHDSSWAHTLVAFLKLTASSRPSAPPSGSPKCLRLIRSLTDTEHSKYRSPRLVRSHYCQQLTLSVCLSRPFKLLLLFCFSMESSHCFGRQFSLWHSTKRCS